MLDDLLAKEYLHIQNIIERSDSKVLVIKTWSITSSFAAIVGAFATKTPLILLIAAIGSLMFWYLEMIWKGFQHANFKRSYRKADFHNGEFGWQEKGGSDQEQKYGPRKRTSAYPYEI